MVPRQLPPKKIAPQLGLGLVLELRQFSSWAIVLETFRILHRQYEISFLKLRCTLRSFIFKSDLNVKHRSNFYRKTIFTEKKVFFCRLCKNYWITCCTHMTSHAIYVDEITGVTISTKKSIKTKTFWKSSFLNKFSIIFHFLSLCVFISIQNIGRSFLLKVH